MKKCKIVIIGAGSVFFGISCLKDAFTTKELWGSDLFLVDTDSISLDRMYRAAARLNEETGAGYNISAAVDRKAALPGADYVIISIAVNRNALWKCDFEIPRKYGIRHILGENGGPGALFHAMRNIPLIIDICKDMEVLCPDALLINFTNPESRICLAISKYTSIKAVGLCHQIRAGKRAIGRMIGKDPSEIYVMAYGLNHFTWAADIRDKNNGEYLTPLFEEMEKEYDAGYEKLSRFLFHKFGLFPMSGDDHVGEFLPYAWEMTSDKGYNYDSDKEYRLECRNMLEDMADPKMPLNPDLLTPSGEKAFTVIKGIVHNTNEFIESVNIPNDGFVSNLPLGAIVEIPAIISGSGVKGIGMGKLPDAIAAMCTTQINVQQLTVDAGVKGDRVAALQALLIDPNVPSADAATKILDELLKIHKKYLPQFK